MAKRLRRSALGLVASAVLLSLSCGPTHTGPTDGVVLYEHPDYKGDSIGFVFNASDLEHYEGPCGGSTDSFSGVYTEGDWDNCASSIMITPGWEVIIYEKSNYRGERLIINESVRDLDDTRDLRGKDWDDRISSMSVRPPRN